MLFFQVLTRSEGDETGWKWAYYGDIPENAVPCADSLMDEGKNKSIIGMLLKLIQRPKLKSLFRPENIAKTFQADTVTS